MHFIIYDLEATCWEGTPRQKTQEIIEIGAVLLSPYGEVKGTFNRFVRPILNPNLSFFCKKLTSIEQHNVDRASRYPVVLEAFQDWCEVFYEDCIFASWGNFDKKMLLQDCELHDMETDWLETHINLKRQYQEIKKLRQPWGLKKSVEREGFEFTGIPHRAISDAENLAKLFIAHIDEWRY